MRALLVVSGLVAGCSWIGVAPARTAPGAHAKYCTDSYFLPVVDTVYAAGLLTAETVGIVTVATHDPSNPSFFDLRTPALLGVGALTLAYAASAVHGYRTVHACNE